ncbi:unannotated protein [freshwater metagenome]|uniref:Unannotated protein n=1 Tax=freshwater metagenome TaxID=449393 RepID=A0A6J6HSG0_9ZZZZ
MGNRSGVAPKCARRSPRLPNRRVEHPRHGSGQPRHHRLRPRQSHLGLSLAGFSRNPESGLARHRHRPDRHGLVAACRTPHPRAALCGTGGLLRTTHNRPLGGRCPRLGRSRRPRSGFLARCASGHPRQHRCRQARSDSDAAIDRDRSPVRRSRVPTHSPLRRRHRRHDRQGASGRAARPVPFGRTSSGCCRFRCRHSPHPRRHIVDGAAEVRRQPRRSPDSPAPRVGWTRSGFPRSFPHRSPRTGAARRRAPLSRCRAPCSSRRADGGSCLRLARSGSRLARYDR